MSAKLASLTDYLIGLNFVPRENLESWVSLHRDSSQHEHGSLL